MRPCDVHLTKPREGRITDCPECLATETSGVVGPLPPRWYEPQPRRRRSVPWPEFPWERERRLGL
jgi:hypothetical protein